MAVRIDENICKSCGLCVSVCPKKIIKIDGGKLNSKGYNPAVCENESLCISCAFCAVMCPDVAIEVYK